MWPKYGKVKVLSWDWNCIKHNGLLLSQVKYVLDSLQKTGLPEYKPISISMEADVMWTSRVKIIKSDDIK